MITLNLKNIVLKKDFTPIKMGISEVELTKYLGKPNDIYDNKFGSVIYFYGGYEFAFYDNQLHYFQNESINDGWIEFENTYFKIDAWLLKQNNKLILEEFIDELNKEEIKYVLSVIKSDIEDEYTRIELYNGIKIEFNKNKILYAIRYDDFEQE